MGEYDLFRDPPIRYLGYANEVGESFRMVVPHKWVRLSYTVAFGYVLADTTHKSLRMLGKTGSPTQVVVAGGDALLWQTFASVILPGVAINRIVYYSHLGLSRYPKIPKMVRHNLPVAIGLLSIPLIIKPIDHFVTLVMNMTVRKFYF